MDKAMMEKTEKAAIKEASAMLKEHWSEICKAVAETYQQFCEDQDNGIVGEKTVFRFPVGLGIEIQPEAGDMRVKAKIRWGITRKDESEGVMCSNQPVLPLGDDVI